MNRKPKFLIAFATAVLTFGTLTATVGPPRFLSEHDRCYAFDHCGSHFENERYYNTVRPHSQNKIQNTVIVDSLKK